MLALKSSIERQVWLKEPEFGIKIPIKILVVAMESDDVVFSFQHIRLNDARGRTQEMEDREVPIQEYIFPF